MELSRSVLEMGAGAVLGVGAVFVGAVCVWCWSCLRVGDVAVVVVFAADGVGALNFCICRWYS